MNNTIEYSTLSLVKTDANGTVTTYEFPKTMGLAIKTDTEYDYGYDEGVIIPKLYYMPYYDISIEFRALRDSNQNYARVMQTAPKAVRRYPSKKRVKP